MKRFLIAAAVLAAASSNVATVYATDVGVSISIGEPGFYGRLDIGDYPRPQVVYREPVLIEHEHWSDRPPVYLRVPPGHAKHWRKHCREYNACGERVYFVRDDWYSREYVPRYREHHREHGDDRRDERHDKGKNRHGDKHKHGGDDH